MKPINLYQLTRVSNLSLFGKFEQQLSHRKAAIVPKEEEISTLCSLVDLIITDAERNPLTLLDHFYFSFTIPKISKEFDLIRIGSDYIVNIELKSRSTQEKILKQLRQNRYYLNSLGKTVHLFAFDHGNDALYRLSEDDSLEEVEIETITYYLKHQSGLWDGDIEDLFKASDFLISPMNTPERFINKEYFLSSQQEEIAASIIREISDEKTDYFGLTGDPGTGKTLLLYDLAVRLASKGKCCVVHCGIMPEGLDLLARSLDQVDIVEAKAIKEGFPFDDYQFILVDESHRFYPIQFERLVEKTESKQIRLIFSYDERQVLSKSERSAGIAKRIEELPGCKKFKLTNKIRTNKELASFIERLKDLHSHNIVEDYSSAEIAYACDAEEAKVLLSNYISNGYTFINYTSSNYYPTSFDCYSFFSKGRNTHNVIGQEFEKVVMLLDGNFGYDDNGKLRAYEHPNPDYLYRQLFFQGASRVREKLAIIVVANPTVLEKALSIF